MKALPRDTGVPPVLATPLTKKEFATNQTPIRSDFNRMKSVPIGAASVAKTLRVLSNRQHGRDARVTNDAYFPPAFSAFNLSNSAFIAFDCSSAARVRTSIASIFFCSSISFADGPVGAGAGTSTIRSTTTGAGGGGTGGPSSRRRPTAPCPAPATDHRSVVCWQPPASKTPVPATIHAANNTVPRIPLILPDKSLRDWSRQCSTAKVRVASYALRVATKDHADSRRSEFQLTTPHSQLPSSSSFVPHPSSSLLPSAFTLLPS